MNLKLLANQVFLRTKNERSNERCVNADEKERSFSFLGMNAQMNPKNPDPPPFYTDAREFDGAVSDTRFLEPKHPHAQTSPNLTIAARWLEEHLTEPRRIGDLMAEWTGGAQHIQRNGSLRWEGGKDGTDDRWIADLCEARDEIGVQVFLGPDGLFWWKNTALKANPAPEPWAA